MLRGALYIVRTANKDAADDGDEDADLSDLGVDTDDGLAGADDRLAKPGVNPKKEGFKKLKRKLKKALKNPQFVGTAMENLDTDLDGKVSLREWLISMKELFDKSEAACKTALKAHEKAIKHMSGMLPAFDRTCKQPLVVKDADPNNVTVSGGSSGSGGPGSASNKGNKAKGKQF